MWTISHIIVIINISVTTCTLNSLKLVQILFRHGDRTPCQTYSNDPYQDWIGWGTLTNKGKLQMYTLGQHLREHYHSFLPEGYIRENVYVRSSEKDRCITSAETLLAGLFPPEKSQIWNPDLLWQPIPVRYVPVSDDNVLEVNKNCPAYMKVLKLVRQSPEIKKLANAELYRYLSLTTGNAIDDLESIERLYKILHIEMQNNLTLPDWTNNVSFEQLRKISEIHLALFTNTTLMKRLAAGPFLRNIVSYSQQKIKQSTNLKLILFSGHDLSVVNILRSLGFEQLLIPEYGAAITFELHELSNSEHEIKLFYNENYQTVPQQLNLKFCSTPCLFQEFVDGLHQILPIDWEAECTKI